MKGESGEDESMADDDVMERVRALRQKGCSPKEIARTLGLPPATVAPLVRAVAQRPARARPLQ